MTMMARTWLVLLPAVILSRRALAQPFPEHGHFFGGDGFGFGAMMLLGPLSAALFLAVVVAIIVLLVRWLGDGRGYAGGPPPRARSPLDILGERFARGEIDKDEFGERRRALGE